MLWGPQWLLHLAVVIPARTTGQDGSIVEWLQKSENLRSLNSWFNFWSETQKTSMAALKGFFISYSCRADIVENQMQNLILLVAELHQFEFTALTSLQCERNQEGSEENRILQLEIGSSG